LGTTPGGTPPRFEYIKAFRWDLFGSRRRTTHPQKKTTWIQKKKYSPLKENRFTTTIYHSPPKPNHELYMPPKMCRRKDLRSVQRLRRKSTEVCCSFTHILSLGKRLLSTPSPPILPSLDLSLSLSLTCHPDPSKPQGRNLQPMQRQRLDPLLLPDLLRSRQ
jgi:hypothetical protein